MGDCRVLIAAHLILHPSSHLKKFAMQWLLGDLLRRPCWEHVPSSDDTWQHGPTYDGA